MATSAGLKQRINRALLLQAGAIAIAAVVGVYLAGVLLKDVLITQALREEARHFEERYAEQPTFPLPDTRNLTGYMQGHPSGYEPSAELRALPPGFHTLKQSANFATAYVTDIGERRLYLVFDGEQVDALATYFGLVPLTVVLLVLYLSVWLIYRASQRAISPIARLAGIVNHLDPEAADPAQFEAPASLTEADAEVRVLYVALGRFAQRLTSFVERERDFTRDASHELRSPLTVIRLATDSLRAKPELPQSVRETVEKIARAARDMEELVSAFLLLARDAEGRLLSQEVCVNEVVEGELERAQQLAGDKPITVERRADCRLFVVASDKVLSVLIGNLIRNAFLYTDAGRVSAHVREGEVVIEDSGVGMEPGEVETLFEPFRRGNPAVRGGHGVGLTIVRRLSHRFDWPVQIESRPGVGTRVSIRFPQSRCEQIAD